MKIAFAQVPDQYAGYGDYFTANNQLGQLQNYYYCMEVQEKDSTFSIDDGCGRTMPFDFESLDELVEVLTTLKEYRDDKIRFEKHWNKQWGLEV